MEWSVTRKREKIKKGENSFITDLQLLLYSLLSCMLKKEKRERERDGRKIMIKLILINLLLFYSTVYARYSGNIRREYCHIPHSDYCQKRAEVCSNKTITYYCLLVYLSCRFWRVFWKCTGSIARQSFILFTKNLQEIILKRRYHS